MIWIKLLSNINNYLFGVLYIYYIYIYYLQLLMYIIIYGMYMKGDLLYIKFEKERINIYTCINIKLFKSNVFCMKNYYY